MLYCEYESKIKGDCADDIDQSTINNEIVKKFLNWAKVLEDTITGLKQTVLYYRELSFLTINNNVCKTFPSFLVNFRYTLCISITILIGKLYADNNDLNLSKFNKFCYDNQEILFSTTYAYRENKNLIKDTYNLYKEKIRNPRDKIYGHSDELLLDEVLTNDTVRNIDTYDLMEFAETGKEVLSYVWKLYNGHDMCFKLEKNNDFKEIINLMIDHCNNLTHNKRKTDI